jgi:DNA-directed RNA polymerase subunit RPC12/RpoP
MTSNQDKIKSRGDWIMEKECINCQQSLSGGELTDRWEDGDNEYAYVKCPHCGFKNILYDYGGDDD